MKSSGLAINNEAIIQIAGIAALEVEGVAGLARRPVQLKNIKNIVNNSLKDHSKSIDMKIDNGAIILDIFINVTENAKVKDVAEAVQLNIKEKVQAMTNNAVANVNVHVDDLALLDVSSDN